jgi:GTP-binding protein
MANIVAIVGRPNVGKSTFFNRLVEKRQAIMDNESGVTRDRHYGYAQWTGKFFTVIDTGGYVTGSEDVFEGAIRTQVAEAMEEASVIVFITDCHDGLHPLDQEFARIVRSIRKPVIVVANKADTTEKLYVSSEFYEMGLGEVFPISASSGSGTGEVLDEVVKYFDEEGDEDPEGGIPKIAILGRPNAGKSSFVNALLGKERTIVTDQAGTTRDSINTHYNLFGKDFVLTDTAGIRKKSKVHEDIEFYSVMRALQALQDSDVCILMIDATRGLEAQDMNIISLALKYKKGIMVMVNKWDLIEKDSNTMKRFTAEMDIKLGQLTWVPKMFTSVTEKQRIFQAIEMAVKINENRSRKITTSQLNDVMLPEIEHYSPPALKGKYVKIKYITQLPTRTPTIAFFCNLPQYIKEPYERFLENKLRAHFEFDGVPINLVFRQK